MKVQGTPYFLWDYNLTESQIHKILNGKNETEKLWMAGRILSSAHFRDIWKYLTVSDVINLFPRLRMRPEITNMWQHALTVWGYHVPANQ